MPGKESTPPFQSKLTPYRNEILKAWFRRQTLREIQAMLQKRGITISLPGISLFIKRHKDKYDPRATPQTKKPRSVKPSKDIEKSLGCVVNRFVLYYANVKKGYRENGECIRTT